MASSKDTDNTLVTFVVHELAHAHAVLETSVRLDIPVLLASAPGAVRTGGAGWWRELISQSRSRFADAQFSSVLDCADEPGMALAAIREGVEAISVTAPRQALQSLTDIANQSGVSILSLDRARAFDLAGSNDPQADCENHLRKRSDDVAKPRALG